MREQSVGTVVIVPTKDPETPEHLLMRVFGKSVDQLVEDLVFHFAKEEIK